MPVAIFLASEISLREVMTFIFMHMVVVAVRDSMVDMVFTLCFELLLSYRFFFWRAKQQMRAYFPQKQKTIFINNYGATKRKVVLHRKNVYVKRWKMKLFSCFLDRVIELTQVLWLRKMKRERECKMGESTNS